jgi:GT2 family glycosyltransferase
MTRRTSRAPVTVVIPAFRAWLTLPDLLDALAPELGPADDVILVDSSGEDPPGDPGARWPWLRIIRLGTRTPPGPARNAGMAEARADVLAFVDADAVPEPGWLDGLCAALTPEVDAVAGAVVNGTPHSAVGTAQYLLEFLEVAPYRRGPPRHAVTCNLLMRADALRRCGGFAAHLGEDTVVTSSLAAAGRLAFAPGARVRHLNRTSAGSFLAGQRLLGAGFAEVARRRSVPGWQLGRPALAPLAAAARFVRLLATLRSLGWPPDLPRRSLIPAAGGLAAWGVGLAGSKARRR